MLAALCAQILSSPAAPNFFTAEVNFESMRFELTIQRLGGKSISTAVAEQKQVLRELLSAFKSGLVDPTAGIDLIARAEAILA